MAELFKNPGKLASLVVIMVFCVGAWFTSGSIMSVGAISVMGHAGALSEEDVIALSGITKGQALLDINDERVQSGIDSSGYVRFESLERQFPSKVVINVSARIPVAILAVDGSYAIVDADGYVIDVFGSLREIDTVNRDLIFVTGLPPQESQLKRDHRFVSETDRQSVAVYQILRELCALESNYFFSELNAADLDNMYLVTIESLKIVIGDELNIREKLSFMDAILEKLTEEQRSGGVLDVSAVNRADYLPK